MPEYPKIVRCKDGNWRQANDAAEEALLTGIAPAPKQEPAKPKKG